MLRTNNIEVVYMKVIQVLRGRIPRGQGWENRCPARGQWCRQNDHTQGHLRDVENRGGEGDRRQY